MNTNSQRKLLVVQVAGLGYQFLKSNRDISLAGLDFAPLEPVFPAVTCTAQASFRTASPTASHGMTGNGIFDRSLRRTMFWEQSSALVSGARIWDEFRRSGKKVALLFWQQSLGEAADIVLSPAPIHKHHGGMIEDCYCKPAELYDQLCQKLGNRFSLRHYWGPMASAKSSQWIAEATAELLIDATSAPDLCMTYLPALDYDLQRFGTQDRRSVAALDALESQLSLLVTTAIERGYDLVVFGDYAIVDCDKGAVLPNLALAESGLLAVRDVHGMQYPDLHASRAFAMVDHEIAHVYIADKADIAPTRSCLEQVEGIGKVVVASDGENHASAGELIVEAADGRWLAYPWWTDRSKAPDYAGHVDIHSKPGYDPCELFWGWPPGSVSQDTTRIGGSHGRVGPGREAAWASSCIDTGTSTLLELVNDVASWLNETI